MNRLHLGTPSAFRPFWRARGAVRTCRTLLILAVVSSTACATESDPEPESAHPDLTGAWAASRYLLAEGPEYEVRGRIFFTERDWQVLFFVMDEEGNPRRGSGEGGSWERSDDGIVFRHLFNLSVGEDMPGLAEAPLRLVARGPEDAPLEPTRVDVDGDVLTLHFPSGNRMIFDRAGASGGE